MINLFHLCHTASPSPGGLVVIAGPLPLKGGIMDQDNATMDAFAVIRDEMVQLSIEQGKKKK